MLWVDKYQPRSLEELMCHPELTELLKKITKTKNIPHLLFYGSPGGGKKTRIMAVLRALYGDGIDKIKAETISPDGINAEFLCCSSLFHTQISATELGTKDRLCVQYMIKQLASQPPAASYATQGLPKYRVFILQEAEKLTTEAQAGLRRTFEKYMRNARSILHCEQLSSIIQPLRSRCFCIRVPLPTPDEIQSVLQHICEKEGLNSTQMPTAYLRDIVTQSQRNLRRAIFLLETAAMQRWPPLETLRLPWQQQCQEIVEQALKEQAINSLLSARELLYELLTSLIPSDLILVTLCHAFVQSTTSQTLKCDYIRAAAHYAYTLKIGAKDIWHLEAFIAQCINFCKKSLLSSPSHSVVVN